MPIDLDELERLTQDVQGWTNVSEAWANTDDFEDEDPGVQMPTWIVGAIDEDGVHYDVAIVDCEQYNIPGDSEKLAKFYAAANPATVLELVRRLREAEGTLNEISGIARIGTEARKPFIIIENVKNMARRSECLSAIERQFFTSVITDDDGEESEDCPLNWGDGPVEYAKNFGELFSVINSTSATPFQRHARQQEAEESRCTWSLPTLPDALAGIWHSSCGATWSFVEGGPEQNGVRYCQGCGKPVGVQPVRGEQQAKSGG